MWMNTLTRGNKIWSKVLADGAPCFNGTSLRSLFQKVQWNQPYFTSFNDTGQISLVLFTPIQIFVSMAPLALLVTMSPLALLVAIAP